MSRTTTTRELVRTPKDEADAMRRALVTLTRSTWDGQIAVLELLAGGASPHVLGEWPTRFFEKHAARVLARELGGTKPPKFGPWAFGYQGRFVWALSTAADAGEREARLPAIHALEEVVAAHGGVGAFVAVGAGEHDDGSFGGRRSTVASANALSSSRAPRQPSASSRSSACSSTGTLRSLARNVTVGCELSKTEAP